MKTLFNNENLLSLDLQFFAEGATDTTTATSTSETTASGEAKTDTTKEATQEKQTLTMEDVQKMIQSENDKIRTEYSKKLKDKDKELENIKTEKMTDEERKHHEFEQLQEELNGYKQKTLEGEATKLLVNAELPIDLVPFVTMSDLDTTKTNVTTLKQIFDTALTKKAEELFKGRGTEHKAGAGTASTISKEDFSKLNVFEATKFQRENPELYNEFTK